MEGDKNNISSCSTLDIDEKMCATKITQLEKKIKELEINVKQSFGERDELRKKLRDSLAEKERIYRRMESVNAAHEGRITEMHCVIAELSKKLGHQETNAIREESEKDESELAFNEGSVSIYNSEYNQTNPDEYEIVLEEKVSKMPITNKPQTFCRSNAELEEEILHLKAQIALLESEIANKAEVGNENTKMEAVSSGKTKSNCTNSVERKSKHFLNYQSDTPQGQTNNLSDDSSAENEDFISQFVRHSSAKFIKSSSITKGKVISLDREHVWKPSIEVPVAKMAERVKLKRTLEDRHITGSDIINSGLKSTEIVEHLVADVIQSEDLIGNAICSQQLHVEIQRLQRRIDNLKLRNNVLSLTLDECKENCEYLYLLCGKYESNAIGLQLALNFSDRAIEAYDVMLALLESKIAIQKEDSVSAEDSRRAVEAVARHLLDRLESEKNINENSLGPWQNNICISSTQITKPWTQEDDDRLRNHVSKLKGRRSEVQNTVVTLESPFCCGYEKSRPQTQERLNSHQEDTKMDLEMAVLMQELLSLRDESAKTKQKLEMAENEKKVAVDNISIIREELSQLQSQLVESEASLDAAIKDCLPYAHGENVATAAIERRLLDALARESQIKAKMQILIDSISASKRMTDVKYAQVQINLVELQKSNLNLSQSLEQCKRKYQSRIKHLEQKVLEISLQLSEQSCQQLEVHELVPETTL